MPTARSSRRIDAPPQELWELVRDPHHLPRWWPRVARVEDVGEDAFTEVMMTAKGKVVRADFTLVEADEGARQLTWSQRVEGTPFARVLRSAETELSVSAADGGSEDGAAEVTIELRQELAGMLSRLGAAIARRAASRTLEEALDGLERLRG